MRVLSSNMVAFVVGVPLAAGLVGAVILSRPDDSSGAAAQTATATPIATTAPVRTPLPPTLTPTRPAPAATATRPAAVATATPEVLRPLSGIRFGMIDAVSNSTGTELPFPAEFAMSAYFVLEPGGARVRYGLESAPFMPLLSGETATGPEWSDYGGHGVATGSGKFIGIVTDWTIDFYASETELSAAVTIGKSGNLPGGQPVELMITVAEAWRSSP